MGLCHTYSFHPSTLTSHHYSLEEESLDLGIAECVEFLELAFLLHLQELVVGDATTETWVALLLQSEEGGQVFSGVGLGSGTSTIGHTELVDLFDFLRGQVLNTGSMDRGYEKVKGVIVYAK